MKSKGIKKEEVKPEVKEVVRKILVNIEFPKEVSNSSIKEVTQDVLMDSIIELLEEDEDVKAVIKQGLLEAIKAVDFKTVFKEVTIQIK